MQPAAPGFCVERTGHRLTRTLVVSIALKAVYLYRHAYEYAGIQVYGDAMSLPSLLNGRPPATGAEVRRKPVDELYGMSSYLRTNASVEPRSGWCL